MEDLRGKRIALEIPATSWQPLERERATLERLNGELRTARQNFYDLRAKREQAALEDRRALAEALRAGTREPRADRVAKLDAELAAATERIAALEFAIGETENVVAGVVEEHRAEWQRDAEKRLEAAQRQYVEAVEALAAARGTIAERQALLTWLRGFPARYIVRHRPLHELRLHGEPMGWEGVIAALRADAQPPEPAPPALHSQPLSPRPPGAYVNA